MARKKKTFNYEFADGWQKLPSTYMATCTISKEIVPIYHKFLVKLIEKKYKNNFEYFTKAFTTKGAVKQQREDAGYVEDDKFTLNAYSDYLIVCYRSCLDTLKDNFNKEAITKTKREMEHIESCFWKHFNRDVKQLVYGTVV